MSKAMKEGCGYRGRASQVRGRARTEALRQEHVCCVQGRARRPGLLWQGERQRGVQHEVKEIKRSQVM